VVKAIKEMRDRKVTGDDDVAGMYSTVGGKWSQNSDTTDQQHTRN